jgi:hypothetical protein
MPGLIQHHFKTTTFSKPTYCDCCSKLLWGISKQGLQCTDCRANIHRGCETMLMLSCRGISPSSGSSLPKERRPADRDSMSIVTDDKEAPALNLVTTTPKNFTRYVTRLGPMVHFLNGMQDVLSWENPSKSAACLLGYCLLCLYPRLVFILPQILLSWLIAYQYFYPGVLRPKQSSRDHALQYLENMKFLQNHMGAFADLYDELDQAHTWLDWSNPETTKKLFLQSLVSAFWVYLGLEYIPLQALFLAGGLFAFVCQTHWFQVLIARLPQFLAHSIKASYTATLAPLLSSHKRLPGNIVQVDLFENQRWWAGAGWVPVLLKTERCAWSDETGTLSFTHIHDVHAPGSWDWVESQWSVSASWTGALSIGTDEQGWQYSDNAWQGSKARCSLGSFTRRRCWTRRMRCLEETLSLETSNASSGSLSPGSTTLPIPHTKKTS